MEPMNVICQLCSSEAELKFKGFPGYQQPGTFDIYHCSCCNLAFSQPVVPSGTIYEQIYKYGDRVPGYDRYWKYLRTVGHLRNPLKYLANTEEAYWGIREALTSCVRDKEKERLLEVGSGLGYLTFSLKRTGYNIVGLDISQTAIAMAKESFGPLYTCCDLFEYANSHTGEYDVVVLTEVFEHVPDPFRFLESLILLVRTGGKIILTTPNKSLYPRDVIWATDLPPIHLWWFSEESIRLIAEKKGLGVQFIDFSPFYKKRFRAINMRTSSANSLPDSIFSPVGELIHPSVPSTGSFRSKLKNALMLLPGSRWVYAKLRRTSEVSIMVCRDRGLVLCAMLEKVRTI
jgi:SAM-dependent methyltransferase